ncbi:MAG: hypothetical protein AYK22_06715 [Thermoplasmatales archaeon SG8-52-3]|nr:MAG: hypothetical protein AYK22_06715 [Thermoplasmatales archaeon SG8-52-3]
MKKSLKKFDNIFNCPKCNKTLWQYSILKDGTKVCPNCYQDYLKKENIDEIKNKGYIEETTNKLIDKGLSELVYNFFEKIYSENPKDEEVKKLWKLFKMKYEFEIKYDLFFKIISNIYENHKEEKELESFEKNLLQKVSPVEENQPDDETQPDDENPPSDTGTFCCAVCNKELDKETYEDSMNKFNKALCAEHQGTEPHRNLFFALKDRGIPCEFEAYDGYRHIDIAIHDIKLYIEIGEVLTEINPSQFLADLKKDTFSNQGNYQTKRLNIEFIDDHLNEIADTLKEVYITANAFKQ